MDETDESLKCAVCDDVSSGVHFGVVVCRACAAFYRRSAVANRKYVCRYGGGNCTISKDIRCCCRACRLSKCEALGMRADAVQKHRDRIGPRKTDINNQQSETETDQPSSSNISQPYLNMQNNMHVDEDGRSFALLSSSSFVRFNQSMPTVSQPIIQSDQEATPLINEILRGYRKFLSLQDTTLNLNTTTDFNRLFDDRLKIVEGNYTDDMTAIRNSIPLVSEFINEHFHPLEQFNSNVKWLLLRHFICNFLIATRSYVTSKYFPEIDESRFMLTYHHYASLEALERVFQVKECKTDPSRMVEIFKPIMTKIIAMITNPMRKLKLSDEEFCGLMGILFWNDTLTNLTPQEAQTITDTQRKIVSELYIICRRNISGPDTSVRFGILCNLVPLINRFANDIASNFSLANMSNSFDLDNFLHMLIPQAF